MIERELKRQLNLLFEAVRELRQANSDLIDRVQELEGEQDYPFKYSTYEGVIEAGDDWQVYVTDPDDERRLLRPRFDIVNHSPDGFSWGYGGSGPSQLAVAMLAHHFWNESGDQGDQVIKACRLAWRFRTDRIEPMRQGVGWSMTSVNIDDWLTDIGEL